MEGIAEATGLTRITMHRRFANRQLQQLIDAIEEARPDAAPALVALYRVTANVLRVKNSWRFTLSHATARTQAAAALCAEINAHTVQLLNRAQRERTPRPGRGPGMDAAGVRRPPERSPQPARRRPGPGRPGPGRNWPPSSSTRSCTRGPARRATPRQARVQRLAAPRESFTQTPADSSAGRP